MSSIKKTFDAELHKKNQQALYDQKLLDDITAGAGYFGFNKPKSIRDLAYQKWISRLDIKKSDRVLDVGCNAGANLEKIRRSYGCECFGIDLSAQTIAAGKKAYPELNLRVGDAEKLPFADASFDAVYSFETFEHVPTPEKMLSELTRVIKPNGRILIYSISSHNWLTWHWWQYHLSGGKYGTGALRDHLPELMINPQKFVEWAKQNKLRILGWQNFHAFFTLLHDEVWTSFLAILAQIIKSPKARKSIKPDIQNQLLQTSWRWLFYRVWLTIIGLVLSILDLPWILCGQSDGFFVLLKKP